MLDTILADASGGPGAGSLASPFRTHFGRHRRLLIQFTKTRTAGECPFHHTLEHWNERVWSHGAASVGGVQIGQALLPTLSLKVIGGGIAGLAAGERVGQPNNDRHV